ncbi:MAG: hypothetical protein Q4P10_04700 [Methanomassiliicoccales archaeon]|nr:hypothetical protein [Methanomassiliicoccales archaeon]
MDPNSIRTEKTTRSGLFLMLLVIAIVAVVGVVAWVFMAYPDVVENLIYAALIILGAIVVIAVVIWLFTLVMAVPYYMKKGESYQDDVSYDMDDIKPVKEVRSDDKKE